MPSRHSWHFITGEYPPQLGGVGDYCAQIAGALASAGDEVHVWAPPAGVESPRGTSSPPDGVTVHRLRSHFGVTSLSELGDGLDHCSGPRRLFLQYVAGAFGYRAMNVPLCLWLRRRRPEPMWLMFHEYAYPLGWRLKPAHNLLGLVTPMMSAMLAARASRIFVSTPAWIARLPARVASGRPVEWLPIPSNVPRRVDVAESARAREESQAGRDGVLIGHFGTYGPLIARMLDAVLPDVLRADSRRRMLLLGLGSEQYGRRLGARHPDLAERLVSTGPLPVDRLAAHLRACDLLVQPYEDGATSRRSSLMAGLALGLPIVTNLGPCTESIWRESGAVALADRPAPASITALVDELLADAARLRALGPLASSLYEDRFALERSVGRLRRLAAEDDRRVT